MRVGERDFDPGERLTVRVCSGDEEDFFAAATLTDELENIRTVVRKSRSGVKGAVMLTRPGLNRQADERLKQAGLELAPDFNPEGYVLLADGQGVIVSANTAAGLFYGVQTLRQLVYPSGDGYRVRAVAVRDAPAMRYRWQQDDWSRGPIPTLEYAKKQVRILSEYKINGYSIYAENLYQSKSHPAINPYGGTITPEEIAELIDYAARYHVEIIPQQQTFGHLHYVLRQERYADLGEKRGSQILSPTEPGAYDFIGDYLGEIVPMFTSEFIHIGCDETFELGRGKSKESVAGSSHADVYLGHLKKVAALPALKDKKLLFWGEIAVEHPEKLDLLPSNVIAVAWDYLPRDSYETFLKPYADKHFATFVAPSAFYGGRVFPDYLSHMKNIRNFVRDGQKYGSMGMLNTSWDDMGEDLFGTAWFTPLPAPGSTASRISTATAMRLIGRSIAIRTGIRSPTEFASWPTCTAASGRSTSRWLTLRRSPKPAWRCRITCKIRGRAARCACGARMLIRSSAARATGSRCTVRRSMRCCSPPGGWISCFTRRCWPARCPTCTMRSSATTTRDMRSIRRCTT